VQYALVLAQLAAAAHRFLLHLQQLANTQAHPDPSSPTLVSPCHTSTALLTCECALLALISQYSVSFHSSS